VRIAEFFRDESCGQCVPCRIGTIRQEEALHRLAAAPAGNGAAEVALIDDVAQVMRDASICGLGQTAASAVQSALRKLPIFGRGTLPSRRMTPMPFRFRSSAKSRSRSTAAPSACPRDDHPPGLQDDRHRDADALLPRDADAGERLPRVRRRGGRIARARAGLLAAGGAGHGDPHRFRARAPQPPARVRAAGSSVDLSLAPAQFKADMARYGADPARFDSGHTLDGRLNAGATVAQPVKIDNDLYVRDYSKCVLCYKCVEACGTDAQHTFAIAVAGRGFGAGIATEFDTPLPESACVYCGNCIGVCPTGALMFKSEHDMRQAGTWDESRQTVTDTICPYCGVGCTLQLHVQDNSIVRVTSPTTTT
jgi:ferredoxin